jgi:hypothetical protein
LTSSFVGSDKDYFTDVDFSIPRSGLILTIQTFGSMDQTEFNWIKAKAHEVLKILILSFLQTRFPANIHTNDVPHSYGVSNVIDTKHQHISTLITIPDKYTQTAPSQYKDEEQEQNSAHQDHAYTSLDIEPRIPSALVWQEDPLASVRTSLLSIVDRQVI